MKQRENIAVKALAFTAAVAAFTATAIMAWYQMANFDALWTDAYYDTAGYTGGYTRTYLVRQDYWMVRHLVDLKDKQAAGQELDLSEKRSIERYEARFDAGATNLRWQVLDKEGKVIYGNTQEDSAQADIDYWVDYRRGGYTVSSVSADWEYYNEEHPASSANAGDYTGVCYRSDWRELLPIWADMTRAAREEGVPAQLMDAQENPVNIGGDQILADENGDTKALRVVTADGERYIYYPTVRACLEANRFGYIFEPESLTWELTGEAAAESEARNASLILWVDDALRVDDQYKRSADKLAHWQADREWYLTGTIVLGVLGVLLAVYLCCGAGHKAGVEGVYLNWFHRVPGDVLLCLLGLGGAGAVCLGIAIVANAYGDLPMFMQLIGVGLGVAAAAAMGLAALVTVCARCKACLLYTSDAADDRR